MKYRIIINKKAAHQQGNTLLVTAILILILTIIVATCVNISSVQMSMADVTRNASNTYYLAVDGVEKGVDTLNKALENQLPIMVGEIGDAYIPKLTGTGGSLDYSAFYYSHDGKLKINKTRVNPGDSQATTIRKQVKDRIVAFLQTEYLDKEISYEAQSDRKDPNSKTIVTMKLKGIEDEADLPGVADKERDTHLALTLESVAKTMDLTTSTTYDTQTVTAKVRLFVPNDLNEEIREYYKWVHNPSEALDSPLVCFSDVVIDGNGNQLEVTAGDMLVKGTAANPSISGGSTTVIADADTMGGVIVQNGGVLHVADNLGVVGNIVGTNGWTTSNYTANTTINIGKDAIANTIGIIDDYYLGSANQLPNSHRGDGITINVGANAITDNDVMIERWTKNSQIDVRGSVFGMSGGSTVTDPNSSSGVFSQGSNTQIKASRMFVAGQPFITLKEGGRALKLFESIGEPFDGVNSIEQYREERQEEVTADLYLSADSPFLPLINGDKVVTNIPDSYAVQKISAYDTSDNTVKVAANSGNTFATDNDLWSFLFQGGSGKSIIQLTPINNNYESVAYIFNGPAGNYYNGNPANAGNNKMYNKVFNGVDAGSYSGLKAYSLAMRSIFYNKATRDGVENPLTFDQVIDLGKITSGSKAWSYDTPIGIYTESGSVDIDVSDYYVAGDYGQLDYDGDGILNQSESGDIGGYPTLIINKNPDCTLRVYSSDRNKNTFNGVIISKGPVILEGGSGSAGALKINGSVIVGGEEAIGRDNISIYENHQYAGITIKNSVQIHRASEVIWQVDAKDRRLYRSVLDALKLTQYENYQPASATATVAANQMQNIVGPYSDTDLTYALGKVAYDRRSFLMMETGKISAKIVSERKED